MVQKERSISLLICGRRGDWYLDGQIHGFDTVESEGLSVTVTTLGNRGLILHVTGVRRTPVAIPMLGVGLEKEMRIRVAESSEGIDLHCNGEFWTTVILEAAPILLDS